MVENWRSGVGVGGPGGALVSTGLVGGGKVPTLGP